MKKRITLIASMVLAASLISAAAVSADEPAWEPSANVEWYITSSPGGGSDIYTRKIIEIIQNSEDMTDLTAEDQAFAVEVLQGIWME